MKKSNWTQQEDKILREELEKKTPLKQLAVRFHRTEEDIYLYRFRHHIPLKEQLKNPLMRKMLIIKFGAPELFKPNRKFLLIVGIGQMKWSVWAWGYTQPTQDEMITVEQELKCSVEYTFECMESRQLNMYE